MASTGPAGVRSLTASNMQRAAALVSATFIAVGILGFVPGITTAFDELKVAGNESEAELLGLFQVSVLHNIVHLGFGVIGLAMARTWSGARTFLIGGGLVYLALWLYGLAIDHESDANFIPLNRADDWLHFALGVAMVVLGLVLARDRERRTPGLQ